MAEQFYTILTNIGKAKIANSLPTGQKLNLVKMKIGDSNGKYYNPSENQTELVNKVYECNITSVEVDKDNPQWITITSAIPSDVGGFSIREVGVFDDTNSLIAIGKYPETYKPVAADGSTKELYIKMTLEVTNAASVELKIDPTVILATKKDISILDERIENNATQLNAIENNLDYFTQKEINFCNFWGSLNLEQMKSQIDRCNNGMYKNMIHSIYGTYDSKLKEITTTCLNEDVIQGIEYAQEKGLKMKGLKIHQFLSPIIDATTIEEGEIIYKNFIDKVIEKLSKFNFTYLVIMNEDYNGYTQEKYKSSAIKLINYVKEKGYKAGISLMSSSITHEFQEISDACDYIFYNWYPALSLYGKDTTYAQLKKVFQVFVKNFTKYKKKYSDKEIILSEIGMNSNWLALKNPGEYYHAAQYPDTFSNTPAFWYYKLIFKYIDEFVKEYWTWYYVDNYNNANLVKLFKR